MFNIFLKLFAFISNNKGKGFISLLNGVIQVICNKKENMKVRNSIIKFLDNKESHEYDEILDFCKNHKNIVFPYDFSLTYNPGHIEVYKDDLNKGFMYVIHNGKKLYAKKEFLFPFQVQNWYNSLRIEQDINSPHRYLKEETLPGPNSIVADLGGAEGMFSLDVIDYVKKVYIFECDDGWMDALRLTFAPYKDKVEIVNKYVGDETGQNMITLDEFFKDREIDYIKADIEGCEEKMLDGADIILNTKVKQLLCCVYHRKNTESYVRDLLEQKNFSVSVNNKFMIFLYAKQITGELLTPPYLRHGVLYAHKRNFCKNGE